MERTDAYSLYAPELTDDADIEYISEDMRMIDELIYDTRVMVGDAFDSTKAYTEGDLVMYENTLYKFIADKPVGNWDATKVEQTDLATEISQGGGSAEVTKEASGNPIEITDGANAPMVKCVSEITGSQDLHGYDKPWVGGAGNNKFGGTYNEFFPLHFSSDTTITASADSVSGETPQIAYYDENYTRIDYWGMSAQYSSVSGRISRTFSYPNTAYYVKFITNESTNYQIEIANANTAFEPYSNICPITAYNQSTISVVGKNRFDKDNVNSITAYVTANSGLLEAGSTEHSIYLYLEQGTYTVQRIIPSSDTTTKRFRFRLFRNVPQIGETGDVLYDGSTELNATVTLPYSGYLLIFMFNGDSAWNARQEVFNFMQIEKGSTATTYEPYTATTHTATFSQSIYQGNADFVGGVAECVRKMIVIDENSGGEYAPLYNCYLLNTTEFEQTTASNLSQFLCNRLSAHINSGAGSMNYEFLANGYGNILFRISGFSSTSDYNTWLASNPLQIVGLLKTPTTEQISPTNLPIKSLFGYNHIESSTGDMEVEYITGEYQPLVDLIQSSKHVYSTAEQIVGTWIDGSTIYEKTLSNTFPAAYDATGGGGFVLEASASYIGVLVGAEGSVKTSNGYIASINGLNANGWHAGVHRNPSNELIVYCGDSTSELANADYNVTIRYTKSTANRSLSRGGEELTKGEPIEEKETKEVIEEPTKEEEPVEEKK